VRASILDKLVQGERLRLNPNSGDGKQGRAISFPEIEPWPEPVNGATLLTEIASAIRSYVVMADHFRDAAALWVLHAWLLDCFLITPRLAIRSPTHRCGKTTLLDVLSCLTPKPLLTANVTPSVIFRVVEAHRPTLFVDEQGDVLHENIELKKILNSGHRRNGSALRNVGDDHEPRAFATYAALAIALIGKLPVELHDRSVVIDLKRRLASEKIESFRLNHTAKLDVLARKAARWCADNAEKIRDADPEMPPAIFNRDADNWAPLLAIADAIGGKWAERTREVIKLCCAADDDGSLLEQLLGDIRDIFTEKEVEQIASGDLVQALVDLQGHAWAEMGKSRKPLTQNRLAKLLTGPGFKIIPERITVMVEGGITGALIEKRVRGYVLVRFKEAFDRYLAAAPPSKCPSGTNLDEPGTSATFQSVQKAGSGHFEKCEKSGNGGPLDHLDASRGVKSEKVTRSKPEHASGLGEARDRELAASCRRWIAEGEDRADLEDALRNTVREELASLDEAAVEAEVQIILAMV
jgi:putative DNA primase/helicase